MKKKYLFVQRITFSPSLSIKNFSPPKKCSKYKRKICTKVISYVKKRVEKRDLYMAATHFLQFTVNGLLMNV